MFIVEGDAVIAQDQETRPSPAATGHEAEGVALSQAAKDSYF